MCEFPTKFGPCQQETEGTCVYHRRFHDPGFRPDDYYHKKVVTGQVQPVETYLTPTELNATMRGRRRADGRRLDQYTID